MTYYRYFDGQKERIIDEEKRQKLLRERKITDKNLKHLEIDNVSLILNLLKLKQVWLNYNIFLRNEKKLKHKLLILNAVQKIKEQLLTKKDTEIVLTNQEKMFLPEIREELKKAGVNLTHRLDPWEQKLKRDKENAREYFFTGRERV